MRLRVQRRPQNLKGLSAYNAYMMQYLPSYKASHPEMNHSDAFGAVGAQWKGLSDEEKKPYQKIADDANAKAALNSGVDEVETKPRKPRKIAAYNLYIKSTLTVRGMHTRARSQQLNEPSFPL